MLKKNNSIKLLPTFFLLLLMAAITLSSCNSPQSSSKNNEQDNKNTDIQDVQNKETDDDYIITDNSEVEVYAGPGTDYYLKGTIKLKDIYGFVLEDGGWIEVKYNNYEHGYIISDSLKNVDLSDIPLLVNNVPATVGGPKYLQKFDFQYRLSGDIDLFEDPDKLNKTSMIEKGNIITVIAPIRLKVNTYSVVGGTEPEISYWLIEANTERGKERAYAGGRDLFDLDNPLKDFSSIKENNLKLVLGDDTYYSASDDDYFKDAWKTIDTFNISNTEIDFWQGFLRVITSSDISLEDIGQDSKSDVVGGKELKLPTLSKGKRTYTNTYTSIEATGPMDPEQLDALLWLANSFLSFLSESIQTQSFNVSLQQCKGEKRIVIYTGDPIESSIQEGRYYGKHFTLLELLLDKGYPFLTAIDTVDENIRSIDPSFNGEKKYSMDINLARQGKDDSPYGMRIIIDKEGNAYGNIVLHQGTYFRVVYDNKVIKDITKDIESSLFQLDDKTTSILLESLEREGFEIITRESVEADDNKAKAAKYDNSTNICDLYKGVINELKDQYGESRVISNEETGITGLSGLCYLRLLDLNEDGTIELIALCRKENQEDFAITLNDYICYVYTVKDGQLVELFANDSATSGVGAGWESFTLKNSEKYGYLIESYVGQDMEDYTYLYGFRDNDFGLIASFESIVDEVDGEWITIEKMNGEVIYSGTDNPALSDTINDWLEHYAYEPDVPLKSYGEEIDTFQSEYFLTDTMAWLDNPDAFMALSALNKEYKGIGYVYDPEIDGTTIYADIKTLGYGNVSRIMSVDVDLISNTVIEHDSNGYYEEYSYSLEDGRP